ncbi:MAG: hypothetical protein MI684_02950 [Chlorobiales bacterium]|nr:hypothetical protein [Chlorobiales bacterium]
METVNPVKKFRGTESANAAATLSEAVMVYTTDGKKLYVHDGSTLGGIRITMDDPLVASHKSYGIDNTGVSDTSTEMQNWIDYCETQKARGYLPPGTYRIDSGLTVDVALSGIIANGALIDASNMTSGAAITLTGSVKPPYNQAHLGISGFNLKGPGRTSSVDGLYYYTAGGSGQGPAHTAAVSINIRSFRRGIDLYSRAYLLNFNNVDASDCAACVYQGSGGTDYGERISFAKCTLYNSDLAVYMNNDNSAMHFTDCSFDFNAAQFDLDGGRIFLVNPHIEATNYASIPINIANANGAFMSIQGGWILCTGSNTVAFATVGASGKLFVHAPFVHNIGTATYFVEGDGVVNTQFCAGFNIRGNPPFASAYEKGLIDGGFEDTNVLDAFLTNDTATITSKTSGSNISISTSTSQSQTGSRSLKASKTWGVGSSAAFAIATPVLPGNPYRCRVSYNKPGSQTGTMYISYQWARIEINTNGVPSVIKSLNIAGDYSAVFTSSATGWVTDTSDNPITHAPQWATHCIIAVNMHSVGAGDIYFDDAIITKTV